LAKGVAIAGTPSDMYPIGMTAFGVAVDIAGNLYVSDANSQITKVTPIASPPLQFVISAGR